MVAKPRIFPLNELMMSDTEVAPLMSEFEITCPRWVIVANILSVELIVAITCAVLVSILQSYQQVGLSFCPRMLIELNCGYVVSLNPYPKPGRVTILLP